MIRSVKGRRCFRRRPQGVLGGLAMAAMLASAPPAWASGAGVCSNDETISCSGSGDCGGNTCYLPTAGGQTLNNQVCMQDAAGLGTLNCTASDVSVVQTSSLVVNSPCHFPGDQATISFVAEFVTTTSRYDIGAWVAQDGGNALTGTCSVSDFPISPDPPWVNLDAVGQPTDTCGGYRQHPQSAVLEHSEHPRGVHRQHRQWAPRHQCLHELA